VGPRAGLDAVAKRKILSLYRELNPGLPVYRLSYLPARFAVTYVLGSHLNNI
jgi:hypothetical protein